MPIGPVDFQPIMPKVNEIARTQNEQQQRMIGGEKQQADSSAKLAEHNTKSVHDQDQANKAVITEKQKEKNKGNKQRGKKNDDDQEEMEARKKEDDRLPQERHTIDIRL